MLQKGQLLCVYEGVHDVLVIQLVQSSHWLLRKYLFLRLWPGKWANKTLHPKVGNCSQRCPNQWAPWGSTLKILNWIQNAQKVSNCPLRWPNEWAPFGVAYWKFWTKSKMPQKWVIAPYGDPTNEPLWGSILKIWNWIQNAPKVSNCPLRWPNEWAPLG